MSSVTGLVRALENVFMGGIIEECGIDFKDNKLFISAMDLTTSVFVQTSADMSDQEGSIGVGDLSLMLKYFKSIENLEASINIVENKLVVKPKGRGQVKLLLNEIDLVPTYDASWLPEATSDMLEEYGDPLLLVKVKVQNLLSSMAIFDAKSVTFDVDKKGKVTVYGGTESDNEYFEELGKVKGMPESSTRVRTEIIKATLATMNLDADARVYLAPDSDMIFADEFTTWSLRPVME